MGARAKGTRIEAPHAPRGHGEGLLLPGLPRIFFTILGLETAYYRAF